MTAGVPLLYRRCFTSQSRLRGVPNFYTKVTHHVIVAPAFCNRTLFFRNTPQLSCARTASKQLASHTGCDKPNEVDSGTPITAPVTTFVGGKEGEKEYRLKHQKRREIINLEGAGDQ
ncbi:hypothetical protein SH501x_000380 [Pirellulaceae bacterium SH501]